MPRWKLASRSLAFVADLAGAGAAVSTPTVPGTRFARGTLLGSPDSVTPPDVGTCAASAARQPSSAGDVQLPLATLFTCPAQLAPCLPRRNQSDSTDSKIGSRCSSPALPAGGTMIPRCAWPGGVRKGSSPPSDPLVTCRSPPVGAPYTGSGLTSDADGSELPSSVDVLSFSGVLPRSNAGAAPVSNAGAAPASNAGDGLVSGSGVLALSWPGAPADSGGAGVSSSGPSAENAAVSPRSGRSGAKRGARAALTALAAAERLSDASSCGHSAAAALAAGVVAAGSDTSNRRIPVGTTPESCEITSSGSHTSAVRPPAEAGRSRTRIPCRAASRATTNSPIRRETATSTTGGLSSRQLAWAISSAPIPTPWSVMSSNTPPLLSR